MASSSTLPVHDLRSASIDYRRDRESKHKWAHGTALGPSRREEDGHYRPARPVGCSFEKKLDAKPYRQYKLACKQPRVRDDCIHSDSSADEDVQDASVAPEPDADITYSYDAARGPSHGSQVLSAALSQAVERYENKVTDKLVHDEYEVLDGADARDDRRSDAHDTGATAIVEDDYEFV